MSLLQLVLGLAGQLHRVTAVAVIVVGLALLAFRCRKLRYDDVSRWANAPADWEWLWMLVIPALAIAIVAALVPPGILWGDEPNGYDVLEYHLQLPREWYELHRIVPLHHNVFSYFPLAMEMHYLLAMELRHSPWGGMYAAQIMHVAACALSVVAVYGAARQFAGKLAATLAALAAANVPWMMLLAPVAYNEGGLLLFGTLAIAWCLRDDKRGWIIAGVLAGFACGVKLTAVPQVLLLVPAIVGVVALIKRQPFARVAVGVATYVLAGLLIFSPWLIRNAVWTHNPVFPEAQSLFGRAHFSETQSKRWHDAHSPRPDQQSPSARHAEAWRQIGTDWRYGWRSESLQKISALLRLLPAGILCALIAFRRPQAWVFLALLIAWLIFWLAFTHLQGRFFVLAIPIAALALALMTERWQIALAACVTLVVMITGLSAMAGVFAERVEPFASRRLLGVTELQDLLPEETAPLVIRQESVALVGDAKAFLYQLPPQKLHYRTVFDVDVKSGQSIAQAWLEGVEGAPHIVIDPIELDRFARTYYGIPPLPPDFPGERDRPFIAYPPNSQPQPAR
jgi:hypothetical protein